MSVLEKRLGSLPVIAEFSRRLDIAGVIDRVCPVRDVVLATHGQVIEVLIGNRLTNPSAIGNLGVGVGVGGRGGVRPAGRGAR